MKIPVQNVYYLLCYAWNQLEERDLVRVRALECKDLAELFARVLANGMSHLRRRGLDRGYVDFSEDTGSLKGKINFNETIKRNLLIRARARCEFDDLSHNVLHNQLVKSTVERLARVRGMDGDVKGQLIDITRWLHEVDSIPIAGGAFRKVQLHRNNSFYRFLLNVCELVHENLLLSEETGDAVFRDFLKDDGAMARLFERFVFNFYKREQAAFSVKAEKIQWDRVVVDPASEPFLPGMQTDMTLISAQRQIIIDTKYYGEAMGARYRSPDKSVKSANLYQLFAYLKNFESQKQDGGPKCEGILLYPTVEEDLDLRYCLSGHPVRIKTISLDQDWPRIHDDLLRLLAP